MKKKIKMIAGSIEMEALLHDTPTARAVYSALPLTAEVNTWGDEIYFSIPVEASLEKDAKEIVALGDIGYWPSGSAFCIFFGQTPVSRPGEIRAASAVNVFGTVSGDPGVLKQIHAGSLITVEKAEP